MMNKVAIAVLNSVAKECEENLERPNLSEEKRQVFVRTAQKIKEIVDGNNNV
jgi:hypothetical protein